MTSLDKTPAVLAALDRLRSRLGPEAFVLADHWASDRCAVGVASRRDPGVLVYISCHGDSPDRFGYELERPRPLGDDFPYRVVGRAADVSFDELADVVAGHLTQAESGARPDSGPE
ncbi:MAG: hypothetical protein ACRDD1_18405 [Planctomycetia bacterium]